MDLCLLDALSGVLVSVEVASVEGNIFEIVLGIYDLLIVLSCRL